MTDYLIASFLIKGRRQDATSQGEGVQASPRKGAHNASHHDDFSETLAGQPVEEIDEDQRIVRRAHDAFAAEREARSAEYRAKKDALAADEEKIARATDFIKTSYLSLALPYLQEETRHWPSWSKMDANRWTAPIPFSDMDGSTTGGTDKGWVSSRSERRRWVVCCLSTLSHGEPLT